MLFGFTDNYNKIKIKFDADTRRTKQKVLLNTIEQDGIMADQII